jgi:alkylated DNA repair dioxygenase AlkB
VQDVVKLPMRDAEVMLYQNFFGAAERDQYYQNLMITMRWRAQRTRFGCPVPRLTAFYGDAGKTYTYSGITETPLAWTPTLLMIKHRIEGVAGVGFNTVLVNLYRDQRDSVAWHSDDEKELGQNPVIASVSFGAERRFRLRHKRNQQHPVDLVLAHGSMLHMQGATQHAWEHCVPKTNQPHGPRVNLTYRLIKAS